MKKTVRYFFLICLVILLQGCTKNISESTPFVSKKNLSREDARVSIFQIIDTPFTLHSPAKQIWYAWAYRPHLLLTAKHLIPEEIARLVIKNHEDKVCPIKQLRIHPNADIALIETSIPCTSWWQELFVQNNLPNELFYLDQYLKKGSIKTWFDKYSGLLDKELHPGMSGSPLFLSDKTIVWIITAQTTLWTEFIPLTTILLTSRPEIWAHIR
jgi:hypothetical protein